MAEQRSSRRRLLDKLVELFKVRGYDFVHRGPVNWASFPFEQHKRAVAICVDTSSVFDDKRGMNEMVLGIEIFAAMPKQTSAIDDGLLDDLLDDTRSILLDLMQARGQNGDPLVFKRHPGSDTAVEAHDATKCVQGLVVNLRLTY